ncbi:O-antigen ligase family protein [Vibrio fluvialis]|nr:O-antigen ligase family protein [Vibrio fluvialis]MBY8197534.1 O-antigen ligase family protein [Vibrio fluvialis]
MFEPFKARNKLQGGESTQTNEMCDGCRLLGALELQGYSCDFRAATKRLEYIMGILNIIAICFSFGCLILGSVFFEPRLPLLDSFSINQLILLVSILFSISIYKEKFIYALIIGMVILIPIYMSLTANIFNASDYGIEKAADLYIITLLSFSLFYTSYEKYGLERTIKIVAEVIFIIMVFCILYKLVFGLFNRNVKFILFGPIVFGRLMGVGLIISLFIFEGKKRIIYCSLFFFATIISFSKGPVLAIFVVALGMMVKKKKYLEIIMMFIFLSIFFLFLEDAYNWSKNSEYYGLARILGVLFTLVSGGDVTAGANYGSIGSRIDMYTLSYEVMKNNPLGVGLGNWSHYVSVEGMQYPHNLFLEVFTEMGVVFGIIFLSLFILPLFLSVTLIKAIICFLMINQLVSGDILDARYWLFFSIFGCMDFFSKKYKLKVSR